MGIKTQNGGNYNFTLDSMCTLRWLCWPWVMSETKSLEYSSFVTAGTEVETVIQDQDCKTLLHLIIYICLRVLVSISGIVGNSITLVLLKRLRHRHNAHILLVYLAVTDILVCVMASISIPVTVLDCLKIEHTFHRTFCLVKVNAFYIVLGMSLATYTLVSLDRLVSLLYLCTFCWYFFFWACSVYVYCKRLVKT